MADSPLDIEGPVTMVGKFTSKPEHADDYAETTRQFVDRVRDGLEPNVLSFDALRYENVHIHIVKFSSGEAANLAFADSKAHWSDPLNSLLLEEPEFKFFATYSVLQP